MTPKRKVRVQPGDAHEGEGQVSQFSIRLSESLLERLDAHVRRIVAGTPGLSITRTQAIRALVMDGLDRAEQAEAQKKAAPPQ